jgi:hypothetical protein
MSVAIPSETDDIFGELSVEYALLDGASSVTTKDAKNSIILGWETMERELFLSLAISQLDALLHTVKKLRDLQPDWDSYGAPVPSDAALRLADGALRRAFATKSLPQSIVPSAEGGVALCWDRDERHAYVEFDNDGGAVAVSYRGMDDPQIIEMRGEDTAAIDAQVEAIRRFFS